jgi:multidrug efflux pump subunit AcrB
MKERRFKISDFAVENRITMYVLTVIMLLAGIFSYMSISKESFPEVTFPYYSVMTIYPGTSPEDMENLVTRRIEKEIKSVDGIKEVTSKSLQDVSLIIVEFETGVNEITASQDIKDAVDKAKPELPTDILKDPEVTSIDITEMPVLNINLSGDLSLVKLKEYADDLQDKIESFEEISKVEIIGALEREIQINVDIYKMQAAGLTFRSISDRVAQENMTISGGLIDMQDLKRSMRITGEIENPNELENILLKDGIYLKDVARIVDGFEEVESYARLNGENVVTLNVIRKSGKNLLDAIDKSIALVKDYKEKAPESLKITMTGDQSRTTRNNISELINTVIFGFLIVVMVLMFFMGIKNSIFVGIAIPISMIVSFIFIRLVGFTVNMVVLMAFILVLGIVVDNAIVVVENIYRHYMEDEDKTIEEAVKVGVGEVAMPVFTGTITTIAPFVPLMFWPGIMGKFMLYIPATIIITLIVSMVVAYICNPVFAVSFMNRENLAKKPFVKKKFFRFLGICAVVASITHLLGFNILGNATIIIACGYALMKLAFNPGIVAFQEKFLPKMSSGYKHLVEKVLIGRRPLYITLSTIALLFFTFFIMGIFKPSVVLFPNGDPNQIYAYVSMPAGTSINKTDEVTKEVEARFAELIKMDNPDLEYLISNVAVNAGKGMFDRSAQDKLAKVTAGFVEFKYRQGESTAITLGKLRQSFIDEPIAGAEIVIELDAKGPPTGDPISIEISGEEYPVLIEMEKKIKELIKESGIAGIERIKSDLEVTNPELIVDIDRVKANKYGITTAYIGMLIRTAIYGDEVSKYREGDDEYNIMLRLEKKARYDIATIMNMNMIVPNPDGGIRSIPISAVATVLPSTSYGGIIRKDFDRVVTLSSNVLDGYNSNDIIASLKDELSGQEWPENYEVKFGGEQDDQKEAGNFLMSALLIAIAMIFVVLVAQFNSLAKPFIILLQILFSMIGILLGFTLFGLDMSIVMTGMGIIAVAGIVVKNAIILIDYIDSKVAEGLPLKEAIIDAGATRLNPVLLTAVSTILGVLPLGIGFNINFSTLLTELNPHIFWGGDSAAFWNPLAWTIIFGLAFATFLTMIVVPALYYMVFKNKIK